jgi:hypothetical protein
MRSLTKAWGLGVALLLACAGCGSDAGDQLTLSFITFNDDGVTQADAIRSTSADVDVCMSICEGLQAEPFTQASINAVFVNRGKADILLDRFTLSIPGSGVPDVTRRITANVIGGRCTDDPERACGFDAECAEPGQVTEIGACEHTETTVNVLLYDFELKSRILPGQCPQLVLQDDGTLVFIPGTIFPETFEAVLTFSGEDLTEERFTVSTNYVTTFADFDNCSE